MNIKFIEETHEYFIDDEKYPSVTGIIGSFTDTSFYTADSANRGKRIHKICEYIDNDTLDESSINDYELGYVNAYRKFLLEVNPEWLFVEQRVASKQLKFAGTFDRYGIVYNKKTILDIKTGMQTEKTAVQLSAYAYCFDPIAVLYGLYLTEDGNYKLIKYKKCFEIFRAMLNVYHWKKNNNIL